MKDAQIGYDTVYSVYNKSEMTHVKEENVHDGQSIDRNIEYVSVESPYGSIFRIVCFSCDPKTIENANTMNGAPARGALGPPPVGPWGPRPRDRGPPARGPGPYIQYCLSLRTFDIIT